MLRQSVVYSRFHAGRSFSVYVVGLCLLIAVSGSCLLLIFADPLGDSLAVALRSNTDLGRMYYVQLIVLLGWEILWIAGFVGTVVYLMTGCDTRTLRDTFFGGLGVDYPHLVLLLISAFFMLSVLVFMFGFDAFADSPREHAALFQAELISKGRLWDPWHDLPGFFAHSGIVQEDGIRVGRVQPGYPLLLSAVLNVGLSPAIMNPLLAGLVGAFFWFIVSRRRSSTVAVWALVALLSSSVFFLGAASYHPSMLGLLLLLLMVYCLYAYEQRKGGLYGVLAGAFLGAISIVEIGIAVAASAALLAWVLFRRERYLGWLPLLAVVGALPFALFLVLYNYSITGNLWVPVERWGTPPATYASSGFLLLSGTGNWVTPLVGAIYLSSPAVLMLYIISVFRRPGVLRSWNFEDMLPPMLILAYAVDAFCGFHSSTYLFAAFPFVILFIVSRIREESRAWIFALFFAGLVYGASKIPLVVSKEGRIIAERMDLYTLVEKNNIENAVILIGSPAGRVRPLTDREMTRNASGFHASVLYALELPDITPELMSYYEDRAFYRYVRLPDESRGRLQSIP